MKAYPRRYLFLVVACSTAVAGAVTFGSQKSPGLQGLFGSGKSETTFGNPKRADPASTPGQQAAPAGRGGGRAPASVPNETGGGKIPDYGAALSPSDSAVLAQFQKIAKNAGISMGELTTRQHLQFARCVLPLGSEPAPTAKSADQCLERASKEMKDSVLAAFYPNYGTTREKPAGPHQF